MNKIFAAGIILLAIMGAAIAEPGNGNGQSGQTDPGNSGDAPGQQTGDNSGQGQGGNPSNGNNGSNDGSQGNAGQGGDDQGDESDDSGDGDQNQGDDQGENGQDDQGDDGGDVEGDGSQDQVDDQEENDQGNDDQVDDQEENNPVEDDLVNDLIHDDGQVIPHDEELLRIALRELAHPAPGPTCRLAMTANLTRATITNECAAPADIGSMVLSQAEHIVIGETPEGRYILGPGQSYEVHIEAHAGTLRLTGIGGYGEYAVCEVTA